MFGDMESLKSVFLVLKENNNALQTSRNMAKLSS